MKVETLSPMELVLNVLREHEKELDRIEEELEEDIEQLTHVVEDLIKELDFFREYLRRCSPD